MNKHEARLRAALINASGAWDLNEADQDAIRWALDSIEKLKAERDEIRAELSAERHTFCKLREHVVPLLHESLEAFKAC